MRSHKSLSSIFLNGISAKTLFCLLLPALMLISIAAYAAGKEFWETKPYDEWTQKECQKMLQDSPWAKALNLTGTGGGGNDSTDSRAPFVNYSIQLQTAPPIRQAMVRQSQIAQKYDSLPAEKKQAFDKNAQQFLEGNPEDVVIVYVSFSTNSRDGLRKLLTHWPAQTVDLLKNSVYLSGSKSAKVPLSQFIPGAGGQPEFRFIFPRKLNGKEILSPEDKVLRLEFDYPVVSSMGDGKGNIEFKTEKMKINDEVTY
jgi:hypothetical protein